MGIAGYRPAGFTAPETEIVSTHGSLANPRLCAGCHVNNFTVTDPDGGFVFQAVGHTFGALPCVDAQGVPTGNEGCAYNTTERTFVGCTTSGCHSTEQVASNQLASLRLQIAVFADILWRDLDADGVIDPAPIDEGMLAVIKRDFPTAINPSDAIITPGDGAEFNVKLFGEGRSGNGDKSRGVHNPLLAKGLLAANIQELQATYPGLGVLNAGLQAQVDGAVGAVFVRQPGLRMAGHTSSRPK